MTSQELKVKLDAANEAVEKRIKIAKRYCSDETIEDCNNWRSYQGDVRDNLYKLSELKRVADNWKIKYELQLNKEQAPKIQVLVDFLEDWSKRATDWYLKNADYMIAKMNEFHTAAYNYIKENNPTKDEFNEHFNNINRYRFSYVDECDWIRKYDIPALTKELTRVGFTGDYSQAFGYSSEEGEFYLRAYDREKLDKIIAQEKQRKYEDLVNRITSYVGEIEDLSYLRIAATGDLNGVVKGTKGTARIETIGAGGYNIQCFHYRVLIHKVKA